MSAVSLSMMSDLSAHPWISCYRPQPDSAMRLFCLPYAGGSATIYRSWQERLGSLVEVCPVQLPGRGSRISEPAERDAGLLADRLASALGDAITGSFALFGHSMGALLAFELTRRLRERGRELPRHLFVSGGSAPHVPRQRPYTYDLPDDEFTKTVHVPEGDAEALFRDDEVRELLLPMLRADFQLVQTYEYTPGVPLSVPVTAFTGVEDRWVSSDSVDAWRLHTSGSCRVVRLPGDHFFLERSGHELLEVVMRTMAAAVVRRPA